MKEKVLIVLAVLLFGLSVTFNITAYQRVENPKYVSLQGTFFIQGDSQETLLINNGDKFLTYTLEKGVLTNGDIVKIDDIHYVLKAEDGTQYNMYITEDGVNIFTPENMVKYYEKSENALLFNAPRTGVEPSIELLE